MSHKTLFWTALITCMIMVSACDTQHNSHKHSHHHEQSSHKHSNLKNKFTMQIKKPNRVSHTYEQIIDGTIEEIMPLYCPVRELDWCENWNPKAVISHSGLVEKDCVFITPHGDEDIVWIVSDYDIEKGHVEMYYHVPDMLITKLEIQVSQISPNKTKAILTYTKTSISEKGDELIKSFTKESYNTMMDSWEKAMNHYLKTGEILTGLPNW